MNEFLSRNDWSPFSALIVKSFGKLVVGLVDFCSLQELFMEETFLYFLVAVCHYDVSTNRVLDLQCGRNEQRVWCCLHWGRRREVRKKREKDTNENSLRA